MQAQTTRTNPLHMQTTANEAVTLHSAALPDLVCTALAFIAPNQPIAVLPLDIHGSASLPQPGPGWQDSAPMLKLSQPAPVRLILSALSLLFNPSVLMS